MSTSKISTSVLTKKYLHPGEKTKEDLWNRVAREIASVSKLATEKGYRDLLDNWQFVPAGRILAGAGRTGKHGCINCFFIGIGEDSVEGIMDAAKRLAVIYKHQGGCGIDISSLRPKKVGLADGGRIPGAPGFMQLFSDVTTSIAQSGRRGALIILLDVYHPDIVDFVKIKSEGGVVNAANVSVRVHDAFMEAVRRGETWKLRWPATPEGEVIDEIDARELYDLIIGKAWENGEPGMFFVNTAQRGNLEALEIGERTTGVNP
ncbi:unnamed protein product, partial [marine sediment metagenome]